MFKRILQNHVLANLTFIMVFIVGINSYFLLPRQQDPLINFNWISITAVMPGASAEDVEKRVTEPLEDAIRKVQDVKFVNSTSRDSISSILMRFNDIDTRTFDKRVADLRREIQNKEDELPSDMESPYIFEVTSANGFPTALVVVTGPAYDENLRIQARNVMKDLERIKNVDRVISAGLDDPELQVNFSPQRLQALGINAPDIADSIAAIFRDISAGDINVGQENWLVRLLGTSSDPNYLASLSIKTNQGMIPLGSIADIERGREEAEKLVSYQGNPAVLFSITKTGNSNTLTLVDKINTYINDRNRLKNETGVEVILVDDQTEITRSALRIMQSNAALGLFLVLMVTWAFLGFRIALLTSIGIPFILAGTFWVLFSVGQTLNVVVLLAVVVSLGMLVDDAVVVVESIYYRLQRGADAVTASIESVREVFAPVTSSVMTTMAAFLPLMLLPGIIGDFMFVLPFVVTIALAISLIEAYWMLPSHIVAFNIKMDHGSKSHLKRVEILHKIRLKYTRLLLQAMRFPKRVALIVFGGVMLAVLALALGLIKTNFFAADPLKIFYVNVEMPSGTPLETTLAKTVEVEKKVRAHLQDNEVRSVVSYSGQMFTETEPFFGDTYGQVVVSLNPKNRDMRPVQSIIDGMRDDVLNTAGADTISFLRLDGGPPVTSPISVKVRGDTFESIRAAAKDLRQMMSDIPGIKDIIVDDYPGQRELVLQLDHDAVLRAGLNPAVVSRNVRLLLYGEVVATMQHESEELNVRVRSTERRTNNLDSLLRHTIRTPDGKDIPLSALVSDTRQLGQSRIRHYNFRRSIEIRADIDKEITDTLKANKKITETWNETLAAKHSDINLDFSGLLDDLNESLGSMWVLMLFGVLLIYLILGTQFRSYFQPFMILSTVPLAFIGVILGLLINRTALSLYTLYGVVALVGIAVNSAIVLITTANNNRAKGMSVLHATVYAARRRVVPILITSLTTIAGLFSLAVGLGGYSLLWGPVASSIVWGLSISTLMTLFVIPLLYRTCMKPDFGLATIHRIKNILTNK